jgi:hypothetical protein
MPAYPRFRPLGSELRRLLCLRSDQTFILEFSPVALHLQCKQKSDSSYAQIQRRHSSSMLQKTFWRVVNKMALSILNATKKTFFELEKKARMVLYDTKTF